MSTHITSGAFRGHEARWADAVLSKIGYKPGWTFQIIEDTPHDFVTIEITCPAIDSVLWLTTGKEHRSKVTARPGVPTHILERRDETYFIEWVREQIRRIELHELDEFFHDVQTKKPYHDPHANDLP